ncbi:hypothetical protein BH20VER2_BH20VER2_12390 [soil metagenome]
MHGPTPFETRKALAAGKFCRSHRPRTPVYPGRKATYLKSYDGLL